MAVLDTLRSQLHANIASKLTESKTHTKKGLAVGLPAYGMADVDNVKSICIANEMIANMGLAGALFPAKVKSSGGIFQDLIAEFLADSFAAMSLPLAGRLGVLVLNQTGKKSPAPPTVAPDRTSSIGNFAQYAHLVAIDAKLKADPSLRAMFGDDHQVRPDIVVWRPPLSTGDIGGAPPFLNPAGSLGKRSIGWEDSGRGNLLHASVSCKWTIRSDRSQNSRTEALNLIRARKGRLPHITDVAAEPMPSRLASIAEGTADIDCCYHIALPELHAALISLAPKQANFRAELDDLEALMDGDRIRDISDLPLDLLI